MNCPRSITFTLPGHGTSPGVTVTVVEIDGRLEFSLSLPEGSSSSADLRGLFFDMADDSRMDGLAVNGTHITDFDTGNVTDLGQGANMNGSGTSYDVGLEFGTAGTGKDTIQSASFTLSNAAGNLTLDDIAHMDFGIVLSGNRLMAVAPAAPDARDDTIAIFEDGAADADSPMATPQGVKLQVLANDSDADGQQLTITHVEGALHGSVTIVDGDDADDLAGDAILYTPDADWSGIETLGYCITDGHGGQDSAHVDLTVNAVADTPALDVQVLAGDTVNQMRIVVTATASDADGSEFIDRIVASGLPEGATLTPMSADPAGQPGQFMQEFVLTLPANADAKFDLVFSAFAKEGSNGDEQAAQHTVKVEMAHAAQQYQSTFEAVDQSIWDSGDAYHLDKTVFIGVDEFVDFGGSEYGLFYNYDAGVKMGFTQTFDIDGGSIDAEMTFDVAVDTLHNKTTDQLLISTKAEATNASFQTQGPEGAYEMDFDFELLLDIAAGIDVEATQIDLLGGLLQIDIQKHFDIIDFDSNTFGIDLGGVFPGVEGQIAWPHMDASGAFGGSVSSTDLLWAQMDVDEFVTGGDVNIFDIPVNALGIVSGNLEFFDADLYAMMGFTQGFMMDAQALTGFVTFEDGSQLTMQMGDDMVIDNASAKDADGDGQVEFDIELVPTILLTNQTNLVREIGYQVEAVQFNGAWYDGEPINLGPLVSFSGSEQTVDVVYNETFELVFNTEQIAFGG